MPSEPNFHDGFVDGILLGEGSARIFVRAVHGEKFTILLGDVKTLVMSDFGRGNIILSLNWLDATDISDEGLFGYYSEPVGADSVPSLQIHARNWRSTATSSRNLSVIR
jgi:hypothetical protein